MTTATIIDRSALLPYSTRQMFELVNDVEAYPRYMQGCRAAEILEQGEHFMRARLELAKTGVKYSFVTYNTLVPYDAIIMKLDSGPFKKLEGEWRFKALSEAACKVSLRLEFEPNSRLLGFAATSLFASMGNHLVSSLTERAKVVYGNTK